MLSRILNAKAGSEVARWNWPSASGPAPPSARPATASAADPAAGPPAPDTRRIAELERQWERQTREAREAGRREGEAAGRAQASAALQPVLEKLTQSIQEIAALRPQLIRAATAELLDLSLAIARRVLHRELSVDPGALEALVAGALQRLAAQEICRIRIHPELEAQLRQALGRAGRGALPVLADATLEPGALLLETTRGKLDASLETQLAEIGRGLADRLPEK